MEKAIEKLSTAPPPAYRTTESKPFLPPEILDQIWRTTIGLTRPRIVDIRCESKMDGLTSSCCIPPLLHVYSRSRSLALEHWPLCFPSLDHCNGKTESKIFFNYDQDTLFFPQEFVDICQFCDIVCKEERLKIRSVAWDLQVLSVMFNGAKFWRTLSWEFDKALCFAFVLREDECVWQRQGKIIIFTPARDPREGKRIEEWRERAFVEVCLAIPLGEFLKRGWMLLEEEHSRHPHAS